MTDPASSPTAPDAAPAAPITWESHLPGWQQWINGFCENWIFAFIVAMAIRHFCLEAFRIPTASMEPMLYGDPAFSKADHVVVDKFLFRFTGPSRWGVTVFQFPLPEVEPQKGEQTDARTAVTAGGQRLDQALVRPLMYRNFVKRAVVLPGDTWYIANGNVYLEQPDGSFAVSRKPASVQDELWQEVYRFGVQAEYQPWSAEPGANAGVADGALQLKLAGSAGVGLLPQQFRNLYLKPGQFNVRPITGGAYELIELSMTSPAFTYRRNNTKGVAWDLAGWEVRRMNSADLDHRERGDVDAGTMLNRTMAEYVGDVRFRARIAELSGTVALDLTQGTQHSYRLALSASGWEVLADGKRVAQGTQSPLATDLVFGLLDDQVFFSLDGKELARADVPPNDCQVNRLGARWSGAGSLTFSRLAMDRDVHYSLGNEGSFLREERLTLAGLERELEFARSDPSRSAFQVDELAKAVRNLTGVRAQMLGVAPEELRGDDRFRAMGVSKETRLKAPPGAYLMLGDNSPQSWDSRCWGYVAAENLRGSVLAVVLPMSRWRVVR